MAKTVLTPNAIWIPCYRTHTFEGVYYDEGCLWKAVRKEGWGLECIYQKLPYCVRKGCLCAVVRDTEGTNFCFQMRYFNKVYGITQ
jgi:hypothetical protein